MDHVLHEIFQLIFNYALFWTSYFYFAPATSQDPHFSFFVQVFMLYNPQNCLRIKSVLTSSSSHGNMDLLHSNLLL